MNLIFSIPLSIANAFDSIILFSFLNSSISWQTYSKSVNNSEDLFTGLVFTVTAIVICVIAAYFYEKKSNKSLLFNMLCFLGGIIAFLCFGFLEGNFNLG